MPTIINGYDVEDVFPPRRAYGFAPGAYDTAPSNARRPDGARASLRAEAAPMESMLDSRGEEAA